MIRVHITQTCRTPHHTSEWRTFNNYSKTFPNLEKAHAWVKLEYSHCKKRRPCYRDTKQGTIQTGHIYCWKEEECSRETMKWSTYYRQDWVSFATETPLNIRARRTVAA